MFYSLTYRESKELIALEREFFYSNGVQKKEVSFENLEKEVIRQKRERRRVETLSNEKRLKSVNGYSRKIKHKLQFSLN